MRTARTAIGCDLGGTDLKVVLIRGNRVLLKREAPVAHDSAAEILALIDDSVCAAAAGLSSLPGLGVAIPGFLDARRRRIVTLSNLPVLDDVPLAARLERRLRSVIAGPVRLDADTNAGAWGEHALGAGRGARRLLFVALGTGLGVAFVADGEVVRISRHTVGQAAHIPIDTAGPRCRCGARGCAETLLCARGVLRRARETGLPLSRRRTPRDVFLAAREGSAEARAVLLETGAILGRLLVILSNFLSPDRIVIGGGLAGAAEFLLPAARRQLGGRRTVIPRPHPTIRPGTLGKHAGAVGAALLRLRG